MYKRLAVLLILSLAAECYADPAKVLLVGDSTVFTYPQGDPRAGWGQVLPDYYNPDDVVFYNYAVGGRSSKSYLAEGFWQNGIDLNPDYVLIQFGHNDDSSPNLSARTLPGPVTGILSATGFGSLDIDWYRNNIRTYINDARAIGATPIIVTPMERRLFDGNGQIRPLNLPWAEAAIAVAQDESVQWIDLNAYSFELMNTLGHAGSLPMHPVLGTGVRDNTHTSASGADTYAQFIASHILFADADFGDNRFVGIVELNLVVKHWGRSIPPGERVSGDFNSDGFVGLSDLLWVVDQIPVPTLVRSSDVDNDGIVGISDLSLMLTKWNSDVPPGDPDTADLNGDGFVGVGDLSHLLSQWNTAGSSQNSNPPTLGALDLDGSGDIGISDLDVLLAAWTFAPTSGAIPPIGEITSPMVSDFNADGIVDINDLRYLLAVLPADPKFGPADLNADGFIGISDLTLVLTHFNQFVSPGHPEFGDVTGDGFVGIEDLNLVLSNWNDGSPVPVDPKFGPADLNADGFIGIADLTLVLTHFNQVVAPGHPLYGDATGDGFVGIEDLNLILTNWNAGTPPGEMAVVPEPASGAAVLCLGAAWAGARRRLA